MPPRPPPLPVLREGFRFSFPLMQAGLVDYIAVTGYVMLAGLRMPVAALGEFRIAQRLFEVLQEIAFMPARNVFMPVLVAVRHDPARRFETTRQMLDLLSMVIFLVSAVCGAAAKPIVLLMFGPRWEAAVPVFAVLTLMAPAAALYSVVNPLLTAAGRTRLVSRYAWANAATIAAAVWFAAPYGLLALAWALAARGVLGAGLFALAMRQGLERPAGPVLRLLILPSAALVAARLAAWAVLALEPGLPLLGELGLGGAVAGAGVRAARHGAGAAPCAGDDASGCAALCSAQGNDCGHFACPWCPVLVECSHAMKDLPPFTLLRPQCQSAALVLTSPHSGRHYRPEFLAQARLDAQAIRRSEDSFVEELFGAAPSLGLPLLAAEFPRAWCDANREPWELDPGMFADELPDYVNRSSPRVAAGLGTIARIVGTGEADLRPEAELRRGQSPGADLLAAIPRGAGRADRGNPGRIRSLPGAGLPFHAEPAWAERQSGRYRAGRRPWHQLRPGLDGAYRVPARRIRVFRAPQRPLCRRLHHSPLRPPARGGTGGAA